VYVHLRLSGDCVCVMLMFVANFSSFDDQCELFCDTQTEFRCDFLQGEGVADLFGPIDML
jgi:hypothetical protein